MNNIINKTTGKVTLDIELEDLVDMVSKPKTTPFSPNSTQHNVEAEELKKAWFKHVLLNIEKLSDIVQELRINGLKELRDEVKDEFYKEIRRVEDRLDKNETNLESYKNITIEPIKTKIVTLTVKVAMWGILAGFVGSSILTIILFLVNKYLLH